MEEQNDKKNHLAVLKLCVLAVEDSWDSTDWSETTGDRLYDLFGAVYAYKGNYTCERTGIVVEYHSTGWVHNSITLNMDKLAMRDGRVLKNTEAWKAFLRRLSYVVTPSIGRTEANTGDATVKVFFQT